MHEVISGDTTLSVHTVSRLICYLIDVRTDEDVLTRSASSVHILIYQVQVEDTWQSCFGLFHYLEPFLSKQCKEASKEGARCYHFGTFCPTLLCVGVF